jgi:hypothetical protein
MEKPNDDYYFGGVKCQGFGQSPENPAPSLFLQSIAFDKDCSVYNDFSVGGNSTFIKNVNIGGSIAASGSISSGGNGNFSGVVAAAGGFASGNPMRLPGASVGGALNKFTGAMDVGGLLKAASGIISGAQVSSPQMQAAEQMVVGEPPSNNQEQTGEPKDPAQFYFNQQRYVPTEIFDTRSGEYYTVLAVIKTSSS